MRGARRLAAAALAAATLAACADRPEPLRVQRGARPPGGVAIDVIAIAPLRSAPQIERAGAVVHDVEPGGVEMVAARLVGALAAVDDLEIAPPDETGRWLRANGIDPLGDPVRLDAELARSFGADAVLHGRVRRYLPRIGGERGAQRPAAVWFELELHLPDGTRLWKGSWEERQAAVSEDLFSLGRAIERDFTWVDAPRLVGDGMRALVADLLAERRRWR